MMPDYTPIPTQALAALAQLLMRKARRQFAVETREQAIMIVRSLRPAQPKSVPLCNLIPTAIHKKLPFAICGQCQGPIHFGEPVRSSWNGDVDVHIRCKREQRS